MSRRPLFVLSAAALATTGLFAANGAQAAITASSTPSGAACQLAGTASFTPPGLTSSSSNFTYAFQGSLTGCQSNTTPSAPTSGKESAGEAISYNGGTYQEPLAKGTGSCSNSSTSGVSISQWADGDYTVVQYTTTGAGAAVSLQGTVISGLSVSGTDSSGAASTVTIPTNEPSTPVGANVVGELTFSTASPTGVTNCAGSGLTSAVINGSIQTGQS